MGAADALTHLDWGIGNYVTHRIHWTKIPWGLHHFGKFLEPSDEWAGRGCCCFMIRWHIVGHFSWSGMSARNLSSSNLNFSVLTLSMSLRYFGNELYNRGPNIVIAFSLGDCSGFVRWRLTNARCYISWVFSGFYFVPHCVINIWYRMLCYLPNIYNYITFTASLERVQFEFVQSFLVI